jgi:hypothetical protein
MRPAAPSPEPPRLCRPRPADVREVGVIDLSAATPTKTNYTMPYRPAASFAALSATEFWVAAGPGLVLHKNGASPWQRYNRGRALSIAGNSQLLVIATESGEMLLFDPHTLESTGTIQFTSSKVEISDDGTVLAAVATRPAHRDELYVNDTLTGAVAGFGVGWVDDSRLLVVRYRNSGQGNFDIFDSIVIANPQGVVVATPPLPNPISRFQRLAANTIYSPELNEILDLTTGATLSSPNSPAPFFQPYSIDDQGAVVPSFVVFTSKATVRAEPR